MSLNKATLEDSLKDAFAQKKWADCAKKFASAVDTYVAGGTIDGSSKPMPLPPTGSGGATHTLPNGATEIIPYTCTGTLTTPGSTALENALKTAFQSIAWAGVGTAITTGINTLVSSIVVAISIYNPPALVGSSPGTGVVTTSTGLADLTSSLETAFTTAGATWDTVATDIAAAIDTFIKAVTIITTDGGVLPATKWQGSADATIV